MIADSIAITLSSQTDCSGCFAREFALEFATRLQGRLVRYEVPEGSMLVDRRSYHPVLAI